MTVRVRRPGVARPIASAVRPHRSIRPVARSSRAAVSPTRGPARLITACPGPRAARNRAVVPTMATASNARTATASGIPPAPARAATASITRSAGTGMGTPASITRSNAMPAAAPTPPARPAPAVRADATPSPATSAVAMSGPPASHGGVKRDDATCKSQRGGFAGGWAGVSGACARRRAGRRSAGLLPRPSSAAIATL
jgi:hypothetical protein